MKIIFDKVELCDAIAPTLGFASTKNTIAATEGILFRTRGDNRCEISAYDLEKGIRAEVSCRVEEEGCYIINAVKFNQIIRTMPEGEVTVEVDDKSMRTKIYGGKARFELSALSGNDFPDMPELRGERGFTIKQSQMKRIIQKTIFAAASNDVRPALNGIFFKVSGNRLIVVTCDGSRLAFYDKYCEIENVGTSELEFNIIVPGKSAAELLKLISDSDKLMKINVARKHIIFFVEDKILFTRLIDTEYVDYERFIPKSSRIFVDINTEELTQALERALLVTEEKQQGQTKSAVICNFVGDVLIVSSVSITGRVSDEISISHEGDDIEIGFNCRFLYDAMKVCDTEKVRLSLSTPLMSMTVEPDEQEEKSKFLLLVLPVRLNK